MGATTRGWRFRSIFLILVGLWYAFRPNAPLTLPPPESLPPGFARWIVHSVDAWQHASLLAFGIRLAMLGTIVLAAIQAWRARYALPCALVGFTGVAYLAIRSVFDRAAEVLVLGSGNLPGHPVLDEVIVAFARAEARHVVDAQLLIVWSVLFSALAAFSWARRRLAARRARDA